MSGDQLHPAVYQFADRSMLLSSQATTVNVVPLLHHSLPALLQGSCGHPDLLALLAIG